MLSLRLLTIAGLLLVSAALGVALLPKSPAIRGHAIIGGYGAPQQDRAYIGPDGTFSPWPGSFGLAIENRPAKSYRYFATPAGQPGFETVGRGYAATLVIDPDNARSLTIVAPRPIQIRLQAAGPAGGPITSVVDEGRGLIVNGRWRIDKAADVGVIRIPNHASAVLTLPAGANRLRLLDPHAATTARPLPRSALTTEGLPDALVQAIAAQQQALLQSLVGDETRPGDPVAYPLAWQRDGAYAVVALARAGYPAEARRLATKFAQDDFFGGFGSEADAPGLALWALSETAASLNEPVFEARVWPDVQRKAALIETMLTATEPVHASFSGPVIPALAGTDEATLVSGPARDGLIDGRMDRQRPVLFVNGVSILGLQRAAVLANRQRRPDLAARWRTEASTMQAAYQRRLSDVEAACNERTIASAVWPTGAATAEQARTLLARCPSPWSAGGRPSAWPVWTYFDIARAHQWLAVGEPGRARAVLDWFDRRDPLPGAHLYWENVKDPDYFGLGSRLVTLGGDGPVTPHYWTAAEDILLRLELLARFDANSGAVVIAPGLTKAELRRPVRVSGVGTPIGPVSWSWDGTMVRVSGVTAARLGPGFPARAKLFIAG